MQFIGLYTRLKPGQEERYEQFHAVVPDDIVTDLRARGVSDWRIWRRGRDVFHVVQVEDYQHFVDQPATNAVAAGWGETTAEFLEVVNDPADPAANLLTEVWTLSGQLGELLPSDPAH